jgi:hypothetical protein
MTQQIKQIPVSSIILDEDIYPRKRIDQRRVAIFAENIRDGIAFDPIEVEPCPDKPGFYRHLDGVVNRGGRGKSHHKGSGWKRSTAVCCNKSHRAIKASCGRLYSRSSRCEPDGQRHQDILHALSWHPPGQDGKKNGVRSKNNSLPFRENASIGKFPKCRFIPGIHRCPGSSKARLA